MVPKTYVETGLQILALEESAAVRSCLLWNCESDDYASLELKSCFLFFFFFSTQLFLGLTGMLTVDQGVEKGITDQLGE